MSFFELQPSNTKATFTGSWFLDLSSSAFLFWFVLWPTVISVVPSPTVIVAGRSIFCWYFYRLAEGWGALLIGRHQSIPCLPLGGFHSSFFFSLLYLSLYSDLSCCLNAAMTVCHLSFAPLNIISSIWAVRELSPVLVVGLLSCSKILVCILGRIPVVRPFGLQKEYLGRLIGPPQDSSGLSAL